MTLDVMELLRQGGLAVVAGLQAVVIVALWRRYTKVQDARVAEIERVTAALVSNARLAEALEKAVEAMSGRR